MVSEIISITLSLISVIGISTTIYFLIKPSKRMGRNILDVAAKEKMNKRDEAINLRNFAKKNANTIHTSKKLDNKKNKLDHIPFSKNSKRKFKAPSKKVIKQIELDKAEKAFNSTFKDDKGNTGKIV